MSWCRRIYSSIPENDRFDCGAVSTDGNWLVVGNCRGRAGQPIGYVWKWDGKQDACRPHSSIPESDVPDGLHSVGLVASNIPGIPQRLLTGAGSGTVGVWILTGGFKMADRIS